MVKTQQEKINRSRGELHINVYIFYCHIRWHCVYKPSNWPHQSETKQCWWMPPNVARQRVVRQITKHYIYTHHEYIYIYMNVWYILVIGLKSEKYIHRYMGTEGNGELCRVQRDRIMEEKRGLNAACTYIYGSQIPENIYRG